MENASIPWRLAPQNTAVVINILSSPVKVLSVKEDRNIYLNGNCFLVRVPCISDFIFQFVHTLSTPLKLKGGRCGRDCMVAGFTTTCAISAYNQVVRSNTSMARCTRYNIMWYSLSLPCDRLDVFSTNKPDRHHINEMLLKVALSTKQSKPFNIK